MNSVCRRYFKDDYEAEECMIEAFVKVFEKINQFKLEGSFEGWIRRIVVNECLMALRSKKQMGNQMSYDDILYEPNPQLPEAALEVQDLLKLVEQLPVGYRTVFNLYAIDGYTHEEIANHLGITESTSKSQLHRARALLQRMIAENDSRLSINY